jgi:hypothetical protein
MDTQSNLEAAAVFDESVARMVDELNSDGAMARGAAVAIPEAEQHGQRNVGH